MNRLRFGDSGIWGGMGLSIMVVRVCRVWTPGWLMRRRLGKGR